MEFTQIMVNRIILALLFLISASFALPLKPVIQIEPKIIENLIYTNSVMKENDGFIWEEGIFNKEDKDFEKYFNRIKGHWKIINYHSSSRDGLGEGEHNFNTNNWVGKIIHIHSENIYALDGTFKEYKQACSNIYKAKRVELSFITPNYYFDNYIFLNLSNFGIAENQNLNLIDITLTDSKGNKCNFFYVNKDYLIKRCHVFLLLKKVKL